MDDMKTKLLVSFVLVSGFAWAQEEYDDMYFNSKDRPKVQETAVSHRQARVRTFESEDQSMSVVMINPTDSYSGRGENPEYQARVRTNPSSQEVDETAYFLSNYQPVGVNQNLAALPNNNFNRWGNSWMMNPWMMNPGMGFNSGWGSPWGWNDPWMMRPGFNSGWSVGMGMGWNSWNNWNMWGSPSMNFWNTWNNPWGMGMGMGWNNCWSCNSWAGGWNPWGTGMGWNSWNNWGWNRPVVIINNGNEGQRVTYQRRQDRSSSLDNAYDNARQSQPSYTRSGREINSGRSRSEANTDYYDRTWRARSESNTATRSSWSDYNNSNSRSSWSNSNSNYNSNGRSSSYESSPSRSSWNSGSNYGGGSRSSYGGGGSSGGSYSGGSRGRGRD